MLSIQYTPIPQQEVIIPATSGGMASYATITTDSYLSQALQGMMQNAAGYVGWSLDQWVQAFTAQAQQRCNSYPESCAGTSPSALGAKYGAIAFQLMSTVSSSANTPQSIPTTTVPISGPNNAFGPIGIPPPQVDVPSTINVPQV